MARFLISLALGAAIGLGIGLYLGWVQFPVQTEDGPASALAPRYRDDYAVMVAQAYVRDGDLTGAIERLRILQPDNIPAFVQELAERTISSSGNVADIQVLVALASSLGRMTPIMEPYRQAVVPGS